MTATATAARKTSKKALSEACDTFFWFLGYITGGTHEETLRQADREISSLEAKAAIVTALAANPAKLTAADSWLMERAASVNARVETYRAAYVGKFDAFKEAEQTKRNLEAALVEFMNAAAPVVMPSNIIPFPR